ncbi:MAG: T9SS type A sorting domain-containing protein [Bacteroidales bacterium]|nr:T9SS type A sorting domain-containing protein [Bacteroidales bacterium]
MKRLVTLLLLFAAIGSVRSAVFLREDFESGVLPNGWQILSNVDQNSRWRIAESIRNGSSRPISAYEYSSGKHYLAGIPSVSKGTYNEWLISPEVTVPVTTLKNAISFETYYTDPNNNMTLRWIEGNDTATSIILWTASGSNEYERTVEVDISKLNGKKGHFAWVFRRVAVSDIAGSGWGIDLIKAETVINGVDLEPLEILSPLEHNNLNMYAVGQVIPVKVRVENNGRVKSTGAKISYTYDGNTVTEDLPDMDSLGQQTYTFSQGFTVSKAGNNNTLTVSIQSSSDLVPDNNSKKVNCFWVSDPASLVQDFESVIPGEWDRYGFKVYNLDNVTQYRNASDANFFSPFCWTVGTAGGTVASQVWGFRLAFTSSDFASVAVACDRWLVFPAVNIANSPTFLQWSAATANTAANEGSENYEVLISTKTNAMADFQVVLEVEKEKKVNPNNANDIPSTRYVDLSSYKGKDIYIAFRDKTSGSVRGMLLLDNLKFLGKDVTYSTGVKEIEKINARIYPNPAKDQLCIEAEDMIQEVVVYNTMGQKVYAATVNESACRLPVQTLANGIYVVRINTPKGSAVEKINVAH